MKVLLIQLDELSREILKAGHEIVYCFDEEQAIAYLKSHFGQKDYPNLILAKGFYNNGDDISQILGYLRGISHAPKVIVFDAHATEEKSQYASELGAFNYISLASEAADLMLHIKAAELALTSQQEVLQIYKMPLIKRVFDICVAGTLLLMLSPLFLLLIILIKMESKGPAFYWQPRVGSNYQIFKFYKFRSMRVNADKMIHQMDEHDQYANQKEVPDFAQHRITGMLIGDDQQISETALIAEQKQKEQTSFKKFKNDPRITRVGHFIRKTSIDELPQLVNVLIGDMSLVGNRPLPLYEAELLTVDHYSKRFCAPAGITGLWQVTERGKANMSADSRKQLDVIYAENATFLQDIKILIKTPFAALQQENV